MVQLSLDGWTYDVFLNFRGTDTRNGFTGNLYNALRQRGINTFFDEQGLQRGEEITPSISKAIKESRIAIVVFSKSYASSAFCLNELVLILKCFKGEGRLVWPIFYDVDPSQVRYQTGSYEEALAKHEKRYSKGILQEWKSALFEAANLSGWPFKPRYEYEYEFIGRITKEVSRKINRTPLHVTHYPVGLECRVLHVKSLLDVGSINRVSMVGIHGIGGIGKTTIARAVYNLIGDQFDGLCFLSNVKENSDKHGLLYLQETLLFELVGEKDIKLGDVNEGVSIISHRLHQKKVLLVLDDVDELQQLQAIAGGNDWFGSGSRIIITTRDKHLLARHGVERIYAVQKLNDEEALQLFSWNAFRKEQVHCSYLGISKRVVLYSSGLPLALEVIGSNFCGKGIDEWISALDGYERAPHTKIFRVLKLSYDTLEDIEKEIFLDVACFFKGERLKDVKDMLLCLRGIKSEYAIGVLIDKSLIKIEYSHLTMHDLVQDMGKEIIRQASPKEPGGRSRLWFYDDILHVLQANTGTDKIEVIILDLPKGKEVQWSGKAFKKMKNLKMLIIRNACFTRPPTYLPNSLRVLDWSHYEWKFLPPDFHPTNLVCLKLNNNSIELLKPFTKNFECLSEMRFSNSEFLTQVPDLSGAPNLKKLCLDDCPHLIEIHDSVGFLSKLRVLSAERCTCLKTLPHGIKLTSLERLRLSWCSSLKSFPEVLEKMEKTTELSLSGTAIEELPYSICNLTSLQMLDLVECKHLKQLPTSILMLPKLWILAAKLCREFKNFSKCKGEEAGVSSVVSSETKFLSFSKCNLSDESLSVCLSYFPNLTYLDLSFNSFTILPACIKECHRLRDLSVEYCKQLRIIEGFPPNLETFKAKNCTSLTSLSSDMLLKKVFQGAGRRKFILPGQRVPEWFHHYSDGESMCFWVRGEFPALVVCVVVGVLDDKDCAFNLKLSVRINGTDQMFYNDQGLMSTLVIDHIFIFDLQSKLPKGELQKPLLKDQWNEVEVLCMNDSLIRLKGGMIKWSGVYVCEQENSKENIRFGRPSSPKRTCHDLYDSNNDLELGCSLLMKKQRTSLDMGIDDCKSLDTQHQRGFALIQSGHETVFKDKGKNLLVNNDGSEWLSLGPCWQQPSLHHVNLDSNLMVPPSTSDTISGQDGTVQNRPAKSQPEPTTCGFSGGVIGGELHQTTCSTMIPTAFDDSSINQIEPTLDHEEMVAFFASLDGDLNLVRPNEEMQRSLERLQDFLSKDFSDLLREGQYSTIKATLEYLSNLSADGGISGEMRSVISELSREFAHWSRDYEDARRKIELTTADLLKADKLQEGLDVIKNNFWEFKRKENESCNKLANLEKRKRELDEQINDIKDNISVTRSAKEMAAKRMRETYKEAKPLKAQSDKLRQQVPHLRDEQESAKKIQGKIKAEWSKLKTKLTAML